MSLQWQQAGNIASSSFTSPIRFYLLLSPFPNSAHILYGKSLASVHGDIGDQILTGPRRELLSDTYLSGSFKCVYTIRNDVVFSSTQYQLLMTKLFSDYCTTISKQIWQKQSVIMELDCSKIPNARISRHGSSCSINVNFLSAAEGRLSFSFLNRKSPWFQGMGGYFAFDCRITVLKMPRNLHSLRVRDEPITAAYCGRLGNYNTQIIVWPKARSNLHWESKSDVSVLYCPNADHVFESKHISGLIVCLAIFVNRGGWLTSRSARDDTHEHFKEYLDCKKSN